MEVLEKLQRQKGNVLKEIVEALLNTLLLAEREQYLKEHDDIGNGYYRRSIRSLPGKLEVEGQKIRLQTISSASTVQKDNGRL